MEIDESQLAKMPPISDILGEANISTQQVIKAMRFSDDPLIIQFFDTYDSLPLGDRDRVSLEAILLKANINPVHFLGSMQLSLREHSLGMMKLIAIANQPNIMQKTVEYAELPGGYRDREQFHTMTGALPSPKGVTVFQKFTNVTPASDQKQEPIQEAEVVETDLNYIFPDSSRMQDKLSPIRQKQLESGK